MHLKTPHGFAKHALTISRCALALAFTVALLNSGRAARLYFTTSDAIPGGGAPVAHVPRVSGLAPGEEVTLFVWVDLEIHRFMAGYGADIRASTPGVFEVIASEMYNPETFAQFDGIAIPYGRRWVHIARQPTLNADGIGGAMLASGLAGATISSGVGGIGFDGTTSIGFLPIVDGLYDSANGAFLAQSITLRALPDSEGKSTGLILGVGEFAFGIDNSVVPEPIYFGSGTNSVLSSAVGASDGTIHAILVVGVPEPSSTALLAACAVAAIAARRIRYSVRIRNAKSDPSRCALPSRLA